MLFSENKNSEIKMETPCLLTNPVTPQESLTGTCNKLGHLPRQLGWKLVFLYLLYVPVQVLCGVAYKLENSMRSFFWAGIEEG